MSTRGVPAVTEMNLAQPAPTHDLAHVEHDARGWLEPELDVEAVASPHVGRGRREVPVRHRGRVADDRVDGPTEDALEDRGIGLADRDDGVGGAREAALVAPQELLPGARQAGHPEARVAEVIRG